MSVTRARPRWNKAWTLPHSTAEGSRVWRARERQAGREGPLSPAPSLQPSISSSSSSAASGGRTGRGRPRLGRRGERRSVGSGRPALNMGGFGGCFGGRRPPRPSLFGLLCFMSAAERGCTLGLAPCKTARSEGEPPGCKWRRWLTAGCPPLPPRRQQGALPVPSRPPPRGAPLRFVTLRVSPLRRAGGSRPASPLALRRPDAGTVGRQAAGCRGGGGGAGRLWRVPRCPAGSLVWGAGIFASVVPLASSRRRQGLAGPRCLFTRGSAGETSLLRPAGLPPTEFTSSLFFPCRERMTDEANEHSAARG